MAELKLVTVGVDTKLGAHYSFPDVEAEVLDKVLPRDQSPIIGEVLILINASYAWMSLPSRIIARVTVDGVPKWMA
jgi:hypothetical protein